MKALVVMAFLSLTGCYNTYTREDLGDLKDSDSAVVIWTVDSSHYHLRQWTIDDQGNVNGAGVTCTSTSTKFDHPLENALDFSGTIRRNSVTIVRTSSTHGSSTTVILLGLIAVATAILIAASFKFGGFGHF